MAQRQDRAQGRGRRDRGLLGRHEDADHDGDRQDLPMGPGRRRLVRRLRPLGRGQGPRQEARKITMSSYLQTVEQVYEQAAREPDAGLCCTQAPVWSLPDLRIPPIMLEMNYG